jgi:hypothetical protein
MYINTTPYSSRIDEVCMHKTRSDGTSQQDLAVQFRRDRAQTTIIYISFSYYHELKLVRLKYESEECSLSRTNLLTILPFADNETAVI